MSTLTITPQGQRFERERYIPAEVAADFLGCSEKPSAEWRALAPFQPIRSERGWNVGIGDS